MKEVHLSSKENNIVLQAEADTTLIITLESNPTTGYSWAIENIDAAIIQNTHSQFKKGDSEAIGAGNYQEFVFKVLKKAATTIHLKYFRHWQGNSSVIKRYQVTLNT